jgi:hypothetical protein
MSEVISFRLDPKNPREAEALKVLTCRQEHGYSTRHILTEALLQLDQTGIERNLQGLMGEVLRTLNQVGYQIENLQQSGVQRTLPHEDQQTVLSNAFVLSVKSAAKHGIALEG